jgi:dynein heavy chain, axonemal
MKGQLNMSQSMEDLIQAIATNQWPGRDPFSICRWESKAWPSMKNLLSQYNDMLLRVAQLKAWSSELVTPYSLWLSGLFNPTSYLTAVMQVTARRTGMPLDQMTTETHVTTFLRPETIDYYPTDGAFVHGLYIEGARWPLGDEAGDAEMVTGTPTAGTHYCAHATPTLCCTEALLWVTSYTMIHIHSNNLTSLCVIINLL